MRGMTRTKIRMDTFKSEGIWNLAAERLNARMQ